MTLFTEEQQKEINRLIDETEDEELNDFVGQNLPTDFPEFEEVYRVRDDDEPGDNMSAGVAALDELARRLGVEK